MVHFHYYSPYHIKGLTFMYKLTLLVKSLLLTQGENCPGYGSSFMDGISRGRWIMTEYEGIHQLFKYTHTCTCAQTHSCNANTHVECTHRHIQHLLRHTHTYIQSETRTCRKLTLKPSHTATSSCGSEQCLHHICRLKKGLHPKMQPTNGDSASSFMYIEFTDGTKCVRT